MVAVNFNASQHEPSAGGTPVLAAGWYTGVISETKMVPAKEKPQNMFLACTVNVQETQGTCVHRFNLLNDNPEAVRIANGQLSKLMHVLGIFGELGDSQQLHNRPFQFYASVSKSESGQTSNNFNDYRYSDGREWQKNAGNAPQGAPPPSHAAPPPPPPAGNFAPPGQAPQPGYAPQQPYGAPPAPPPAPGYPQPGQAPAAPPAYGAPPQGYPQPGQPPAPPPAYGAPPQPGYGAPPPGPAQGMPPQPPGGYPPPPPAGAPPAYGQAPQAGYPAPPPPPPGNWPGAPGR